MSLTGLSAEPTRPKLARELKLRIGELFDRYTLEEVMLEIAKQKPKHDIYICPAGQKRKCCRCGTEEL